VTPSGTPDDDGRRAARDVVLATLFAAAFFPLLYVLSIGPVAFAVEKLNWDKAATKKFYAPVIWLHDHTPLKRPLELYLGLFGLK
jgi:hypothetical protein